MDVAELPLASPAAMPLSVIPSLSDESALCRVTSSTRTDEPLPGRSSVGGLQVVFVGDGGLTTVVPLAAGD